MRKGSLNSAINLSTDNMQSEIPWLNDKTLVQLKQKYPEHC